MDFGARNDPFLDKKQVIYFLDLY